MYHSVRVVGALQWRENGGGQVVMGGSKWALRVSSQSVPYQTVHVYCDNALY